MVRSVSRRKSRLMRFPKKVRDNFGKFKGIIERVGKNALITGVLLGGMVGVGRGLDIYGGATSKQDSIKIELNFWLGYIDAFQTFGIDGAMVSSELADEIYKNASTKEDSTTKAINFWLSETGYIPHSSADVRITLEILARVDWKDLATFSRCAQRISDGWLLTRLYLSNETNLDH